MFNLSVEQGSEFFHLGAESFSRGTLCESKQEVAKVVLSVKIAEQSTDVHVLSHLTEGYTALYDYPMFLGHVCAPALLKCPMCMNAFEGYVKAVFA